jgi:hypothetical protein
MNETKSEEIYRESHHIFPTSIFGKNKRTVNLTPREHYIAHWLLYKICLKRYGELHPRTKKMANAMSMMICESALQSRMYPSRYYDHARNIWRKHWENPSKPRYGKDNHMYQIGENHPRFGVKLSDETKRKIGDANKGRLAGTNNPSKREDVRKKISDSWIGREPITRDKNPRTKITEKQVKEIQEMWLAERNHISGYAFCRKYCEVYGVKPAAIGNLIQPSRLLSVTA